MAVISIKAAKPFIEKKVQAKGIKENILVGIKVYTETELKEIRKVYLTKFSTVRVTRMQTQLDAIKDDIALTDEEFDQKVISLEDSISKINEDMLQYQKEFTRDNVNYIKNASVVLDGVDLLIPDTRDAKPIESLWKTPEECLAVLLDMYLESPFYKDSLSKAVSEAVFSTDFKGEELGN